MMELLIQSLLLQNASPLRSCLSSLVEAFEAKHVMYVSDGFLDIPNKSAKTFHFSNVDIWSLGHREPIDAVCLLLSSNLYMLRYLTFYNLPQDVLLVIVNFNATTESTQTILEVAWFNWFEKTVVVQWNDLKLYSFDLVGCGVTGLRYLGACGVEQVWDFGVDLSNCTIHVGGFVQEPNVYNNSDFRSNEGFEIAILRVILGKLGLLVEFYMGDDSLEKVFDNKLNLACGGIVLSGDGPALVLFYSDNEMSIFVPLAEARPAWENPIHIFDMVTWTGALMAFLAFTVTWHFAQSSPNLTTTVIYTLSSVLSSVPHMPGSYRPYLLSWLFFILILTNAFTGHLIAFLFRPMPGPQMTSLNDLITQGWSIADTTFYPYLIDDFAIDQLNTRHEFCSDCYSKLLQDKFAYASSKRHMNYIAKSVGHIPVHKFHSLKNYLAFFVYKRSIYRKKLREIAGRMFDVGLVQHFDVYNYKIAKTTFENFKVVGLKHLYLIGGLYFAGLGVSCLAFLGEYWVTKLNSKCRLSPKEF